jgi:predicted nucleic acid-binding Zn ribbon protein
MRGEIKEKIEAKRREIRGESERLRKEAVQNRECANCGNPLESGNRVYCSVKCSYEFFEKYDYSSTSKILKDYANQLRKEYDAAHPREERQPWSQPVARIEHICSFCGTPIRKGEKYDKYVRLPEYDEWFYDDPYGVMQYHVNCLKFINIISEVGILGDEGWDEDEVLAMLAAISTELNKEYDVLVREIVAGVFPPTENLKRISREFGDFEPQYHWESDNSGYRYFYSVRYESFNRPMAEMHISLSEIKDPVNFFSDYYRDVNGGKFNRILSVRETKIPLSKMEIMEGLK